MKTVPRVIDLGNGYGKVVRFFFAEPRPACALTLSTVIQAYKQEAIPREEAARCLSEMGYNPDHFTLLLDLAEKAKTFT